MMVDEHVNHGSNPGPSSAESSAKEVGTGTPLHEELRNPLFVDESEHRTVLGVGPGTPLNEPSEDDGGAPAQPDTAETSVAAQVAAETQPTADATWTTDAESAADAENAAEMEHAFAAELEQALDSEPEPGEIVQGKVIRIDDEGVIVDIGYKSEGVIPREEFVDGQGQFTTRIGDEVEVLLERRENKEGFLVLSKRKVDRRRVWTVLRDALADGRPVSGVLSAKCKGGYQVDLGGVRAFLPGSQFDLRPGGNPDSHLGETFQFNVIKFNRERGNVVVSRKNLLLEQQGRQREELFSRLAPGRLVAGTVKNLTTYGAFVDLGGVDGLLHVNDMAWSKVGHPRHIVKPGDRIEVMVLSMDQASGKIALGLKQKSEDPWVNLAAKYPVGSMVQGEVVSLTDFGAFLKLEEGVEGLLPVSEMSWTRRVRHPKELLKTGDSVRVKVLSLDPAAKKISLGLKQTEPEPFGAFADAHRTGEVLEGVVKSLAPYGAFVEVAEGVTGLLHVGDMSWDASFKQPADLLKPEDRIQVKILDIQRDKKKIALGLKQLQEDPWTAAARRYTVGKTVQVTVLRNTKFGIFVQLEPGIEGLIHASQLDKGKGATDYTPIPEGERIEAKIVKVNLPDHKIGLSLRELVQDREQAEMEKYLSPEKKPGISLGEMTGVSMEELLKRVQPKES